MCEAFPAGQWCREQVLTCRLPLGSYQRDRPVQHSPPRCQSDTIHHFLNFLFIPKDVGLHSTDLVLLVSDLLLQLGQLRLQGLHSTVRDAARRPGEASVSRPSRPHFLTVTPKTARAECQLWPSRRAQRKPATVLRGQGGQLTRTKLTPGFYDPKGSLT